MIIFYDILLLDNVIYALEANENGRWWLRALVLYMPGRADIGSREIINFSSTNAKRRLSEAFTRVVTQRWEGFILKCYDSPYFSLSNQRPFIKLKKDYIPGLGDTADFVIIGGRRDATDENELGLGKLWWTSFYIACVENKDKVGRFDAKPRFRTINKVNRHSISKANITYLDRHGYFARVSFAKSIQEFDVVANPMRHLQPVELFRCPFIVEVVRAGFNKPTNARYYTLRFPRLLKIHEDRSINDAISFKELQDLAHGYLAIPEDKEQEEQS